MGQAVTHEESRQRFITALHAKLDKGAVEHGDKSFELSPVQLLEELQDMEPSEFE